MPIPAATQDPDQLVADLHEHGVAIVKSALDDQAVRAARSLLEELATEEREAGHAIKEDGTSASGIYKPGPNQRVADLLGKRTGFDRFATHPVVLAIARRIFAASYGYPDDVVDELDLDSILLSSLSANIANAGGLAMTLHTDQGFVPPQLPFPVILNVIWPLVDFTETNGATNIAPGSHLVDPTQYFPEPPPTKPLATKAGNAVLIDGRTWHGTGTNQSNASRPAILANYCPPWVRPFDTSLTMLEPTGEISDELLGRRRWFVYGNQSADLVEQAEARGTAIMHSRSGVLRDAEPIRTNLGRGPSGHS